MIVQRLLKPDAEINSEYNLFFHSGKGGGYDTNSKVYFANPEAELIFDTYFNALPLNRYQLPPATPLSIRIKGSGKCIVTVEIARATRSWDILSKVRLDLDEADEAVLTIPTPEVTGLIFLSFTAVTDLEISEIDYRIEHPSIAEPTITGVITTFKRDAAVQKTAQRLSAYFKDNTDIADRFQLLVIDNGGDTDSVPFPGGRVLKNPNYGGAGGFSRGLLTIVTEGLSSHCLFMDDDASFFPEAIRRTLAVLSFNSSPDLAIAGALITKNRSWMMWENGAIFDGKCHPLDVGKDLRKVQDVIHAGIAPQIKTPKKYGGWWYFCFPVEHVEKWPFPFFVRGDDVNFALSNSFDIKTVLGVVSHQEDFFAKQTPLTVYLDMRSHFVHHLTVKNLERSLWKDIKSFSGFFYRFNASYHYEAARSVILAIEDLMRGEEFWVSNLDMSRKRQEIAAYTRREKIAKDIQFNPIDAPLSTKKPSKSLFFRTLRKWTLNGHLLPSVFFFRKGRTIPIGERNDLTITFLRPFIVRYDYEECQGYIVKRSNLSFFKNYYIFFKTIVKYIFNYKKTKSEYLSLHRNLTSMEFWRGKEICSS